MPKLHLKRMVACLALGLAIGGWQGFQAGWKGQEFVNSNPAAKFIMTGGF
ncbi:MAG: hypothetical protein ACRC62_14015 [Microcoleus sp.]